MTKSSVSQDESLLLPPESREPCRKPAASAGEVSVFCSCCCISPSDCGSQRGPLTAGPGRGDVHTLPPQGTGTQPDPSGHSPAARPGARWGCCCWSCCRSPSCGARARARAGLRARARQAPGGRGRDGPHPRPTARGCQRLRTRTPDLPGRPQPVGTHTSSRRRWRQGRGGGKTHRSPCGRCGYAAAGPGAAVSARQRSPGGWWAPGSCSSRRRGGGPGGCWPGGETVA